MMNGDEVLWQCNETELLSLARTQGLGHLRHGIPKEELVAIVSGELQPTEAHFAETHGTRRILEKFISDHWDRVSGQLPGCTGKCTTYPCSDGRHILCFKPNKQLIVVQ